MVNFFLYLIIFMIIAIFFIWKSWNAMRLSRQTIIAFTGTLGSGKTYLAVREALKSYKLQLLKNKLYKFVKFIPLVKKLCNDWKFEATLFSNIPVIIRKKTTKELTNEKASIMSKKWNMESELKNLCPFVFSKPLKKEHLIERGLLPEKCVVLIDEVGQFASQWEFDNPLVMEQFGSFLRFFRHWLDGRMYLTDQTADGIVKQLRSRVGMIYHLHDFHRYLGISPFFYVSVIPLLLVEEANNTIETHTEFSENYFFGVLPLKFMNVKKYASRCYKPLYTQNALRSIEKHESLYTRYLIDISVSQKTRKDYQANKQKYKDYLYKDLNIDYTVDDISKLAEKSIKK